MSGHRRRIRWPRVIGATIVVLFLIILLAWGISSCGEGADESSEESSVNPIGNLVQDSGTVTTTTADSKAEDTTYHIPMDGSSTPDTTTAPAEESSTAELPDYSEVSQPAADVYAGNLVLVNKDNPSHLTEKDLDLVLVARTEGYTKTYHVSYPGRIQISRVAFEAFNKMMTDYEANVGNHEIMFNYGYLKDGDNNGKPESSSGLDIQLHLKKGDSGYGFISNTGEYQWIYQNMHKYGFVLRYPKGKEDATGVTGNDICIRYVGAPHAAYMTENNLCLEEYLKTLKEQYSFDKSRLSYNSNGQNYEIYYVPASMTGDTKVPVPLSGNYEISGNNADGYIVTAIS